MILLRRVASFCARYKPRWRPSPRTSRRRLVVSALALMTLGDPAQIATQPWRRPILVAAHVAVESLRPPRQRDCARSRRQIG